MSEKENRKLGYHTPTSESVNKPFQEDAHGNFRIVVKGQESEWVDVYDGIATLTIDRAIYIGVSPYHSNNLPVRRALRVEEVDEDGEANFYKFKIIDLVDGELLDPEEIEGILRDPAYTDEDYIFTIKESKMEGYVKMKITEKTLELGIYSLKDYIMTKKEVEEYLRNNLPFEEFDILDEEGIKINE